MPKAEDYLYPNQMIVEIDDYNGLQAELDRLRAEVARLHERLEDNHWFEQDASGNMVRVECDPGSIPDGISFRDETIKLQDENNDRLRAEKAELVKNAQAVGAYASAIEAATIERCAQLCDSFEEPHMARLIRKLAKTANDTEGK